MGDEAATKVTQILNSAVQGDEHATDELLPLVYDELRKLAARRLALEAPGQTLQATALVHEAYLRLVGDDNVTWSNRRHFFGAAAEAMRRILVERARRKGRVVHGGKYKRVDLNESSIEAKKDEDSPDMVFLDEALRRMEREDPRMAEVVKLRLFAGLSVQDTARALEVSTMTVKRDWACARAWLYDEIHGEPQ